MFALASALLMASCGMPQPGDVELAPQSSDALLLMYAGTSSVGYNLSLASYDTTQKMTTQSPLGGWVHMHVLPGAHPRFVYFKVPPGTYAVHSFRQQSKWALCFHEKTYAFVAPPAGFVYLGALDPRRHLMELNDNVRLRGGSFAGQYDFHHYFENISPPQLLHPTTGPGSLAHAQQYATNNMTKIKATVSLAELKEASFPTGYSLMGKRNCGGFFRETPKN